MLSISYSFTTSHIQSYFYHDDPSLAAQNFNYTLDFSLDVGATVLGLKKINAGTKLAHPIIQSFLSFCPSIP